MNQEKPRGKVLVLGGGIAGIEAAMGLSEAGYGVYLVERSEALGGMMPSLHRIYPLCACCKLEPRVAACEQDPNIQVLLNTTVTSITGEAGRFQVMVKQGTEDTALEVGAVLIAAGMETFDPSGVDSYAYGRHANVLTSVEYEQIQKPTGPQSGRVKRPSDGRPPRKIAWLQCVGSRDINLCDAPYCSSVCCMYALKEAVNTKDLDEEVETTIFYMDMRAHGKGFEEYLNRALDRGVRLVRSRVHTIEEDQDTKDLEIVFADEAGELQREQFDMVVLSVGLRPSQEAVDLARRMDLGITEEQYLATLPFSPLCTTIPGIYVCGGVKGPNDIGQSVVEATAAVAEIAATLAPEPFSEAPSAPAPSSPPEGEPAVLFAYHLCEGMDQDLGDGMKQYAEGLPGVVGTLRVDGDMVKQISEKIKEYGADRLVFAGCTPVIHKNLLEQALRAAGLNPYLAETVDLRALSPEGATVQVQDRVRMAVARAAFLSPPALKDVPVVKHALVVGGGISGMESALALAREGYPVTLVEREEQLGGHGRHLRTTWDGHDGQAYLQDLLSRVKEEERITVMTGTRVKENRGFAGSFVTTLDSGGQETTLTHGVTILATGAQPYKPEEYLYGSSEHVYLWSELSEKLIRDPAAVYEADTTVFIQCVGSRGDAHPHCSNLCCTFAVRTAVDLKAKKPEMNVYILYRDMRTFGEREKLYREARQKGVIFIRYEPDNRPQVEASRKGTVKVTVYEPILRKPVVIEADLVSLQTAIVGTGNREVADLFRVDLDQQGFLVESPEKLKPLDTTIQGVFMAGLAAFPKDSAESITQARGAAARALEFLAKDSVQVGGLKAEVISEKCAVCCTCVRTCPFQVPFIDGSRGAAFIDPALCQGCGMCVAECPGKAIVMSMCSDDMLKGAPSVLLDTSLA